MLLLMLQLSNNMKTMWRFVWTIHTHMYMSNAVIWMCTMTRSDNSMKQKQTTKHSADALLLPVTEVLVYVCRCAMRVMLSTDTARRHLLVEPQVRHQKNTRKRPDRGTAAAIQRHPTGSAIVSLVSVTYPAQCNSFNATQHMTGLAEPGKAVDSQPCTYV